MTAIRIYSKGRETLLRKALFAIVLMMPAVLFAQKGPVDIGVSVKPPFRFVAFGDTRFTDPKNVDAASPQVRQAMVKAIADEHPAFISIGGDIVYRGGDGDDWRIYDDETALWREQHIEVFPALGNHELYGKEQRALGYYFSRFPDLQRSRYYSVHGGNALMLVLDSSLDETSGPQGTWLKQKFESVAPDVAFVFVVLHHPPYTASSDLAIVHGGGHSARSQEKKLAAWLESQQAHMHARVVVFSGHVHNYEHYERGGVTYFVTGGGGAHPYHIKRAESDPLRAFEINYHYLLVEVSKDEVKVTMKRLDLTSGTWSEPDKVTITANRQPAD